MLVINAFILYFSFLLVLLPTILVERIVLATIQNRFGPNISGVLGLVQSTVDGLKTFFKQILFLKTTTKKFFILLPTLLLFFNFLRLLLLPTSAVVEIFDFELDSVIFYTLSGFDTLIFILTTTLLFKSKFSRLSIGRELVQMCTLEILFGISFLIIVLFSGTLNIRSCINIQTHIWFIFIVTPFGILFLISILGSLHRIPFDNTEAEAELTAGYQTEFSGILFSVFYLSEYLGIILSSILLVEFYLGGFGTGFNFMFIIKLSFSVLFIIFARAVLPRVRIQSLVHTTWIYIIPVVTALFIFSLFLLILLNAVPADCLRTIISK